jgi:hypothetical protein
MRRGLEELRALAQGGELEFATFEEIVRFAVGSDVFRAKASSSCGRRYLVVLEEVTVSDIERNWLESRPSIVLTAFDRERLTEILGDALSTADMKTAFFLRQEIERADIAADDVPLNSVVRIDCEVKFVDHAEANSACATCSSE